MNRIIKIGMDVHSTNYTLCAMEPVLGAEDRIYGEIQVAPDYKAIVAFIASIKMKLGLSDKYSFECGYEEAASDILCTTSSQVPVSNVSFLRRRLC